MPYSHEPRDRVHGPYKPRRRASVLLAPPPGNELNQPTVFSTTPQLMRGEQKSPGPAGVNPMLFPLDADDSGPAIDRWAAMPELGMQVCNDHLESRIDRA